MHRIARMALYLLAGAAMTSLTACGNDAAREASRPGSSITPSEFLESLDGGGFPPVESPWRFRFPADHGPHGRYRTEWWHLAGVLADEHGSRVGVQLSVARIGFTTKPRNRASRWAATDVYAGQFSLSGASLDGLHTYQRISRGALGLAGARTRPVRVWVENWRVEQITDTSLAVHAAADGMELDLELRSTRPPVDPSKIPGQETGRSPPFVFYLQPRLAAAGALSVSGRRTRVSGPVSMEHAWGELPFPGGPVARDRFTLYIGDARELFCIRTHRVDGSGTPATTCLLTDRTGDPLRLSGDEVQLEPLDHRESGPSGVRYPIRWMLRIPGEGMELEVVPYSEDQAGTGWTPLWAGPVRLVLASDRPAGYGFVQLNGYDR